MNNINFHPSYVDSYMLLYENIYDEDYYKNTKPSGSCNFSRIEKANTASLCKHLMSNETSEIFWKDEKDDTLCVLCKKCALENGIDVNLLEK